MNIEDIKNIKIEGNKITEEELDSLYIYLSLTYHTMTKEEQVFWYEIMQKLDEEFYEQD